MDTSLSALAATPRPFLAAGKTYLLHPMRLQDFGAIEVWVQSQVPSPFQIVAAQLGKGLFTPAQERELLAIAVREARYPKIKLGSPEFDAIVATSAGLAKFVHLAIAQGDPKFTEEQAVTLVNSLGMAAIAELNEILDTEAMTGTGPENESDPKDCTGGTSTTPP